MTLENKRVSKGYTQQYMADQIGISIASYNYYENGQRDIPKWVVDKIKNILEINRDDIFLPSKFSLSEHGE